MRRIDPIVAEMRARRESLGMSQAKLANRAGFIPTQIWKWEKGQHHPSIYAVTTCLQALGLKLKIVAEGER